MGLDGRWHGVSGIREGGDCMTVNITGALFSFSYTNFSYFVLMYRIDFSFLMYFDRTYTHLTFPLDISPPSKPSTAALTLLTQSPPPYQNQPPSTAPFRTSKPNHKHELQKNHHQNVRGKTRWSDNNKTRKREEMPRPRTERKKSETHLFFSSFLLVFSFLIPGFGGFF